MGTDNLFHKRRKGKSPTSLKRKKARRAAYKKILIVCEGEKTETNYFEEAREYYALNTVNVEVRGDCGSAPENIVSFAKQRYREEKDAGDPFDQVFCVFDKDEHSSYEQALYNLRSANPNGTYFSINSVPCFEYWLLLHYDYSTRPFLALPNKSPAKQVISKLREFIPNYDKGQSNVFFGHLPRLEKAKVFAKRSMLASQESQTDNPSTRVHELVETLQKLKT